MKVYVDGKLVRSKTARDHIEYLSQMFNILRKYQMKLNPPEVRLWGRVGQIYGLYDKST